MSRLDRLHERRIDPAIVTAKMEREGYRGIQEGEAVRFAVGAMQPIDPEYTKNTFAQGDRVRDQLNDRLSEDCEFRYQGSTTRDTHIKARSDIDLLVLLTRWNWVEPPLTPTNPYRGDTKADMRELRRDSEEAIAAAFPRVDADTTGAKSITLEGGSLTRRVDVVPATWSDTATYENTGDEAYRGVKIFDVSTSTFLLNRPFLFKRCVEEKDTRTRGGMRKAARLMKSLMYESEQLDMSSFNIESIAFNIRDHMLAYGYPQELRVLEACREYCGELQHDANSRSTIRVPDDSRTVFGGDAGATLRQLGQLVVELDGLIGDIARETRRSFETLARGRVEYAIH